MPIPSKLMSCFKRFKKDEQGVAAIEMAFILPLMVTFIFTSWELSNVYLVKKRTDHAATVLADLTTQSDTISTAAYNGYIEAVEAVMYPFNKHTLKVHVIGVSVDKNKKLKLAWQRTTGGGTGLTVNDLPAGLRLAESFYVISETEVAYKPGFLSEFTGTIDLKDSAIMVPRLTTSIVSTN
jgi:Flp pilus assembly protein TadG